jgi:hypothetical protein
VNLASGIFSGYAWSANVGWISLSNTIAYVQTDSIQPGVDANGDGIPDAWELLYFATINIDTNADANGNGVSNLREYLNGANPLQPGDYLQAVASTIDAADKYAYGANIGWVDLRADATNGAVIGQFICSGYIYSANTGWIKLGSGFPTNGIYYQNLSASDFGVNQDGHGNLRGYAYGANIGWIHFEDTGAPKVDLATGNFSGYAWSANVGWISLSNAVAYVKSDTIQPGVDSNGDGIPDAWELQHFGTINVNTNADTDHDGKTTLQEYLAGTDPNNPGDYVQISPTTIAAANRYSYGAKLRLDGLARRHQPRRHHRQQYVCLGFIYSANAGWIKLGNGAPINGIQYQNNSANDFGVNEDGSGNLRGFAWGANVGWINFERHRRAEGGFDDRKIERLHLERERRLDFVEQRRGLRADGGGAGRRQRDLQPRRERVPQHQHYEPAGAIHQRRARGCGGAGVGGRQHEPVNHRSRHQQYDGHCLHCADAREQPERKFPLCGERHHFSDADGGGDDHRRRDQRNEPCDGIHFHFQRVGHDGLCGGSRQRLRGAARDGFEPGRQLEGPLDDQRAGWRGVQLHRFVAAATRGVLPAAAKLIVED